MDQSNQGILHEYYEEYRQALRIELNREPTHDEIMYHINQILRNCHDN